MDVISDRKEERRPRGSPLLTELRLSPRTTPSADYQWRCHWVQTEIPTASVPHFGFECAPDVAMGKLLG